MVYSSTVSALRWLKANAATEGIDANLIVESDGWIKLMRK